MHYMFDGFNDVIRLEKGEHLREAMEQFVRENKLPGAWLSGLGAAQQVELGFYNLDKKEYYWQTFDGLREVLNLTGNLAINEKDEMVFHLHGVFGNHEYDTIGGHVKDLVVGGTLELFVHRTYKPLHRKSDEETGLSLLDV